MGQVIADMSMSIDGYVAEPDDRIDQLFGWFFAGDVETPTGNPHFTFRTSEASAARLRAAMRDVGAIVGGRRYFDLAGGWGGAHPLGVPVFVVTHHAPAEPPFPGAPFHFVTDGVEAAVARAKEAAGDKVVGVASPDIVRQCLDLGLLDAVEISLVPVVLGAGVPFFSGIATSPVHFDDPEVIEGLGVTHLKYRVRK